MYFQKSELSCSDVPPLVTNQAKVGKVKKHPIRYTLPRESMYITHKEKFRTYVRELKKVKKVALYTYLCRGTMSLDFVFDFVVQCSHQTATTFWSV